MNRNALKTLESWKDLPARKPLVVEGAPRVGKTTLLLEFGQQEFEAVARVDLAADEDARRALQEEQNPDHLLALIGALTGTDPLDGSTLVLLDDVQECPHAIAALGPLLDTHPEVPVIACGTGLRTAMARCQRSGNAPSSWSAGKAMHLCIHPLAFDEFVEAAGNGQLAQILREGDLEIAGSLSERYLELLKAYIYVGGMPEAVEAYLAAEPEHDQVAALSAAREAQTGLLARIEDGFNHLAPSTLQAERIRQMWRAAPGQLAREGGNKRFIFAGVSPGARGRDYRTALAWLEDAGLVTRVAKVSEPVRPLRDREDPHYFKLYLVDVGLLGAATDLEAAILGEGDRVFLEHAGAYAEQYVCQQLVASNLCTPCYWAADGKREKGKVDFVYEYDGVVYPLEVRPAGDGTGIGAAALAERYGLEGALRLSLSPAREDGLLLNLPLWAANLLP